MKIYLVSLGAGVLVGLIYALLAVRSPAPPAIALVGLLGMLLGEQVLPVAKKLLAREPVTAGWVRSECVPRITGLPPAPAVAPASERRAQADGRAVEGGAGCRVEAVDGEIVDAAAAVAQARVKDEDGAALR